MDYKMLKYGVEDGVAVITLDYAPTLNALDMNMALELDQALKQAEGDPAVKTVVLTGAGRAFCGGGDIRYMKAHCEEPDFGAKSMAPLAGKLSDIVIYIKHMTKLVICAVAGAAAGGGCNLAYGCDFVFAADNAKFLQAFVGIALMPDTMGGYLVPRMAGLHRAMDMFVTGRPVTAQEALELGFVKEVVPKDELMPKVMAFAKGLAKGPTHVRRHEEDDVREYVRRNVQVPRRRSRPAVGLRRHGRFPRRHHGLFGEASGSVYGQMMP